MIMAGICILEEVSTANSQHGRLKTRKEQKSCQRRERRVMPPNVCLAVPMDLVRRTNLGTSGLKLKAASLFPGSSSSPSRQIVV